MRLLKGRGELFKVLQSPSSDDVVECRAVITLFDRRVMTNHRCYYAYTRINSGYCGRRNLVVRNFDRMSGGVGKCVRMCVCVFVGGIFFFFGGGGAGEEEMK